jgi:hypothetical protein
MPFIKSFETIPSDTLNNSYIYTKINTDDIEKKIIDCLDKHSTTCKFYINITDKTFVVSFNVGLDQYEIMCETSFEIKVFKDNENNSVIFISNEVKEHHQWSELYNYLLSKLK